MRRLGSAAIDLCYVAAGRLDGFWEMHLGPWDIAAGALIVEEAGGPGDVPPTAVPFASRRGNILASNGPLHEQMLERDPRLRGRLPFTKPDGLTHSQDSPACNCQTRQLPSSKRRPPI